MTWQLDKSRGICPQICQQLCAHIAAGEFLPNQRLMSVREVAMAAGVNPNTVQRAFEQLEKQGILYSERGAGWFVADNTQGARELYRNMVREKVDAFFDEMKDIGISPENAKKLVEEWQL